MTIVNDDSRVINKFGTSLTDDARVVIYDCHVFIVQATGVGLVLLIKDFVIVVKITNLACNITAQFCILDYYRGRHHKGIKFL